MTGVIMAKLVLVDYCVQSPFFGCTTRIPSVPGQTTTDHPARKRLIEDRKNYLPLSVGGLGGFRTACREQGEDWCFDTQSRQSELRFHFVELNLSTFQPFNLHE